MKEKLFNRKVRTTAAERSDEIPNKVHDVSKFLTGQDYKQYALHNLLKNVLVTAQCFAIMPVDGVTAVDYKSLKFEWKSFKTIYSFLVMFLQLINTVIVTVHSAINSENFFSFVVVVWNVRALLGLMLFLKLARKWPALIRQWSEMETNAISYGPLPNLKVRYRVIGFLFLLGGLVEHFNFIYGGVRGVLSKLKDGDDFLRVYFENLYQEVFGTLEYTFWIAILVEFLALSSTFQWQFVDVLLILLSCGLAERFQQITRRIREDRVLTETEWRDVRKQYNKLSLLCKTLNDAVTEIVLLSFFGNIYFSSILIFNSFRPKVGFEVIYFWYGLVFNAVHFFVLCLYCAWVHEESLEPITEIASVSARYMSHEVDRILHQMSAKDIAIYGGGTFKVTRGAMLNIASVIVTLQLIFVQFNAKLSWNIK